MQRSLRLGILSFKAILLSVGLLLHPNLLISQVITATGNWSVHISAMSLPEAGTNFNSTYTSSAGQTFIDIDDRNKKYNWRIDVRKSDLNWNSNLLLYIRRTGNGVTKAGAPLGGTNFQLLTNTNQYFFHGTRDNFLIPLQYQLTGVSVTLPAQNYSTNIIFTYTVL